MLLRSELSRLKAEYRQLEEQQRATQRLLETLIEREDASHERLESRLAEVQVRADYARQQVGAILNSRIWKALVGLGGVALRLAGRQAPGVSTKIESGSEAHIHCDEPAFDQMEAVTGKLNIRGWAVAKSGVRLVEVRAGDGVPVAAKSALRRPDIGAAFPAMNDSVHAGFQCTFDTTTLPSGTHTLTVRALDHNGGSHEVSIALPVDHIHGFASPYDRWIREFEDTDPQWVQARMSTFARRPLISILVPVFRTPADILRKAIESVRIQSYGNWELCIADDGSKSEEIDAVLDQFAEGDTRIRLKRLPRNQGISAASNAALAMAQGDYVALLDHDDELATDALFYFVEAINQTPDADILYSDEDHMDEGGRRFDPFFKPDWSPDLILSENYVCHLMVFQRELAVAAGGFRTDADCSQDHDILLRMSPRARRIVHIPRVLYHWRTAVHTIERASANESRAVASSQHAVASFLRETAPHVCVEEGNQPGRWRVRYPIPGGTRLSILIPSGGKLDVLRNNIETLVEAVTHPQYEILIVDNSKADKIRNYVESLGRRHKAVRYLDRRSLPFNYSHLNNAAVDASDGDLLLFLNDDTRLIEQESITAMMELAARPEVGAVGAKLLYPDGRIQHAGVAMGIFGICGHSFKGLPSSERLYFDFPDVIRNVSAVTGACLMTRRAVFEQAGRFDEEHFPVAYNDIDLCLRIGQLGYRILYTPHAVLTHYEAFSKTMNNIDPTPRETAALKLKWADVIARDPFYSPNLSTADEGYSLRRKRATLTFQELEKRHGEGQLARPQN